jgi:hypothetical protein
MYEPGQWLAICQRCGGQHKARKLRLEWTGLRVCHGEGTRGCWEKRHPQDFVKGKADKQAPPWTSPRPEDSDVITNDWTDF